MSKRWLVFGSAMLAGLTGAVGCDESSDGGPQAGRSSEVDSESPSDGCDHGSDGSMADADSDVDILGDDSDSGSMCYADFPCFGHLALCSDDSTEIVRMRDVECHEVCGPGPCSGGACHEAGREPCGDSEVCVPTAIDGSADQGAVCMPTAAVCGGPDGYPCAAGSYCEFAADNNNGSACQSMRARRYGVCRAITGCDSESGRVCGCRPDDATMFVHTSYPSECELMAAGDALDNIWACPSE